MSLWRERLIAAGLIRPWTKELPPIQLPPGTVVFRQEPEWFSVGAAGSTVIRYTWKALATVAVYHSRPGSGSFVRDGAS